MISVTGEKYSKVYQRCDLCNSAMESGVPVKKMRIELHIIENTVNTFFKCLFLDY